MSCGTGASLVLSKDVPAHPCLQRFIKLVSLVGRAESGNALNDVHRAVDAVKSQAVYAPGVYDVKKMRALLGEKHVGLLYEVAKLMKLEEDLTLVNRMPKPPPVKDFFARFEPKGILRDLGTGNGAKADDSGVETVGYEDHATKAPDVLMTVKPVSEYLNDVTDDDVTSTFLSATSSYYNFEPVGDAMHVYPDIDYMLEHGLSTERDDGLYQSGTYVDKRFEGGEPISAGYEAKIQLKDRRVEYTPIAVTESQSPMRSLGNRITNNCLWLELEDSAVATYKYDGRRIMFRQFGTDAYMIDSDHTVKFSADTDLDLDLDFELVGNELILMRVSRVGPLRPYDTYQALQEFLDKITLCIPGFEVSLPELFEPSQYEHYLRIGRVDGKTFRRYGKQYVLKHHMSLDFRAPVDRNRIRQELADNGFVMSEFDGGPGAGDENLQTVEPAVEEYMFKKNSTDTTVRVVYKRNRPLNKRTDTYKDVTQINWPTTEKKPVGLERQPTHHVDLAADFLTLERVPV